MRRMIILLTVCLVVGAGANLAQTQTFELSQTLTNPSQNTGDGFGSSVTAFGPYVLVGAPYNDAAGTDAGAAYLYRLSGGLLSLERTFLPTGTAAGSNFGFSVTGVPNGSGGYNAVVGAWLDDTGYHDSGAVYLFDAQTGDLIRKIENPTAFPLDYFGISVAAFGGDFLVGAVNDFHATGMPQAGTVYRFNGQTGDLVRIYGNPQPKYSPSFADKFGQPIAAFGDDFLVGAYDGGAGASPQTPPGYAYLVDADTGALRASFQQPSEHNGNGFNIVAAYGNQVLVGAWGDDIGADAAGSVYVFDPDGTLRVSIPNPFPAASDSFGSAVTGFRSYVLVGARLDDVTAWNSGAAYLFDGSTGNLHQAITPPTGAGYQGGFGHSVSAMGSRFLAGAPGANDAGPQTGSVYVYRSGCNSANINQGFSRLLALIAALDITPGTGDLTGPNQTANRALRQALSLRASAVQRQYNNSGGRGDSAAPLRAIRATVDGAGQNWVRGQGAFLIAAQIDLLLDLINCYSNTP